MRPAQAAIEHAISQLDPDGRFGSDEEPRFLALASAGADVSIRFLGLTHHSEPWLVRVAGEAVAHGCRDALNRAFRQRGHESAPDHAVRQVLAAAAALVRAAPSSPLTLSVMPMGVGERSGSGLAYSCDPATGRPGLAGLFGRGRTGEQVLAYGGEDLRSIAATRPWGGQLADAVAAAQSEAAAPVRLEFVVERDELYVLARSTDGYSPAAWVRAVAGLGRQGDLDLRSTLCALAEVELAPGLAPGAATTGGLEVAATGIGVSPGVAVGAAVFSAREAVTAASEGLPTVLILPEARPADLPGLLAASAVVTAYGGRTSHAAVVTRGLNRPGVTALVDAQVDVERSRLRLGDGRLVAAGAEVTVDGEAGVVYLGSAPTTPSGTSSDVDRDLAWLLGSLPENLPLPVRANADTAEAACAARAAGAAGIGLCRVEHIVLGEHHALLQRALLSPRGAEGAESAAVLCAVLRSAFQEVLRAMDGLPVAIRLLDPPRHEFLPDSVDLAVQAERAAAGHGVAPDWLGVVRHLREHNPMLGVRGVRLAALMPDLAVQQLRALIEAVLTLRQAGGDPRPELLVPMVADPAELDLVRSLFVEQCEWWGAPGLTAEIPVGAMVETPRAALLSREIANRVDSISIGTNDLTALAWGLSRDDVDATLLPTYQQLGVVPASPFAHFDIAGVGALVRTAVAEARAAKPQISIGVCGEHAADSSALPFFVELGIDYLSCAPPAIPATRLGLARLCPTQTARGK